MTLGTIVFVAAAAAGQANLSDVTEVGRLSDPAIAETSALEASSRYPGVFWTVSDSGNPPHLVALDRTGNVLATYRPHAAVNFDWECLALDAAGRLYICDVGNNALQGKSRLPQRWIYVVREPDPRMQLPAGADPAAVRPLPLERTILMRYPREPFDIEAAFARGEEVFFISKVKDNAAIYRLPRPAEPAENEAPVTLEKVLELPGLNTATGAALSDDGRWLAVCTYKEAHIYEVATGREFGLISNRPRRRVRFRIPEVEACAWDRGNVLLLNELGVLCRLGSP